ncbi:MAG: beta-galactosidase GalA [Pseudomonadota bacterium]
MSDFLRRDVLAAGLALPAASLLPSLANAQVVSAQSAAASLRTDSITAIGPREQMLFDFGWKFTLGHGSDPAKDLGFGLGQGDFAKTGEFNFSKVSFDDSTWRALDLPHDWAIELPFVNDDDSHGDSQQRSHGYKPLGRRYPETSVGWYRRTFDIPASDAGRRIWVEFDGAFRDVLIFVNGCFIGRNNNGYAPFRFDISDFLTYGGKNVIVARVDASFGDGWFYEGAGIYRHVWLLKTAPVHLGRWDSVVRSSLRGANATLDLSTIAVNTSQTPCTVRANWILVDADGAPVAQARSSRQTIPPGGSAPLTANARLDRAKLWSVENPHLYAASVSLESDGAIVDGERVDFGVRSTRFDADHGFFLNDQHVKIQGVCNHQDHAGVGAAVPDRLQAFRVSVMQGMGCNAIRTSHNMPTPELVAACDRMGVMMMCETRLMNANTEGLAQLDTMVKRYRNSPSIILWSIGNEEWILQDRMAEQGARIAETMVRHCHALDPTREVTAAVNGDNRQGVSVPLDVIGFNYNLNPAHNYEGNKLDPFHRDFPRRALVGSETASSISTRGEYVTDPARNTMNSYDGRAPWGETAEQWWKFYGEREWLAGGFAWTGFDYRGEPTPYGWPSINSQFGITDMCGFPKDYYFYYKAWWGKQPSLHLFPHWNWAGKEGAEISVWVYSNLDEVELLVNGASLGRQPVPHLWHVEWKAIYQPGAIEARGYKNGALALTERRETTGAPAAIRLTPDRQRINADGEDLVIVTVEALDASGRTVPTARNKVAFHVSGSGTLIGVGNGDPNCLESDKEPRRSLFNGFAQIIVRASKQPGDIVIEAVKDGAGANLTAARLVVPAAPAQPRAAVA